MVTFKSTVFFLKNNQIIARYKIDYVSHLPEWEFEMQRQDLECIRVRCSTVSKDKMRY